MALSTLPDESYDLKKLRSTLVRLIGEIRRAEAARRPGGGFGGPPGNRFAATWRGSQRSVFESSFALQGQPSSSPSMGPPMDDGNDEEDGDGESRADGDVDVGEIARLGLEALAAEVDEQCGDISDVFDDAEVQRLGQASAGLAAAADALEVAWSARRKLKGKGKADRRLQPTRPSGSAGANPPPKPATAGTRRSSGNGRKGSSSSTASSIAAREARSVCRVCGQLGRWAGDPQCPGGSVDKASAVHLAETGDDDWDMTGVQISDVARGLADVKICKIPPSYVDDADRNIMAADSEQRVAVRCDSGPGITDTACAISVCGSEWRLDYVPA